MADCSSGGWFLLSVRRLGLVVVDEQQKFGVNQRWKLLLQKANAASRTHFRGAVSSPSGEGGNVVGRGGAPAVSFGTSWNPPEGGTGERIETTESASGQPGRSAQLASDVAPALTEKESASACALSLHSPAGVSKSVSGVVTLGSTQSEDPNASGMEKEPGARPRSEHFVDLKERLARPDG